MWRTTLRSAVSSPSMIWGRASTTSSHRTGPLLCQSLPPGGEEPLPQLLAGPVQAHLGGRLADTELGGDRLVGQVVDVTQDDDRPQARRQILEGDGDAVELQRHTRHDLRVAVDPTVGDRRVTVELLVSGPAPTHHMGRGAVGGDPVHPGRKGSVAPKSLE